ncbi:hypothetical protein H1R20_g11755, partial [Candolleomyces eurysporus]
MLLYGPITQATHPDVTDKAITRKAIEMVIAEFSIVLIEIWVKAAILERMAVLMKNGYPYSMMEDNDQYHDSIRYIIHCCSMDVLVAEEGITTQELDARLWSQPMKATCSTIHGIRLLPLAF